MFSRVGIIEAGWVLGAMLVAAACDLEAGGLGDPSLQHERKGGGGGGGGGTWIGNGLVELDLGDVSPAYGLETDAGLHPDADSLQLATYLVECALPEDDAVTKTVDGQPVLLEGLLGLAPEWKDEPCEEDCQEWVSACLMARVNVAGDSVDLWLTATNPAIGLGHHPSLPIYEATFYGNVFQGVQAVCRGPQNGQLGAYLDDRTCDGEPVSSCGFADWGGCGTGDRCLYVNGFATDCATGLDPASGVRYRSVSTFVSVEGWSS
jgi:hypothetical protein